MSEPTLDVTQRLDRLERENRRLKRIGGVVLAGLAALVLMGQAMPGKVAKVVEAEKFVVRDRTGRERAVLGVVSGDHPRLVLYDAAGKARVSLSEQPADPSAISPVGTLALSSDTATAIFDSSRISLSHSQSGANLFFSRVELGMKPDGSPSLAFWDKAVKLRAGLALLDDRPALMLLDANGNRAVLGHTQLENAQGVVEQRPASSLVFSDKDGKVLWSAP